MNSAVIIVVSSIASASWFPFGVPHVPQGEKCKT